MWSSVCVKKRLFVEREILYFYIIFFIHIIVGSGVVFVTDQGTASVGISLCVFQALALSPLRMKTWWRKCVRSISMTSTTKWYACQQ